MLTQIKEWRIRRLLVKREWLEGYLGAWGVDHLSARENAELRSIQEKLRQLGWDEEKTVVRIGLPQNYLRNMLKKSAEILNGEQDNA